MKVSELFEAKKASTYGITQFPMFETWCLRNGIDEDDLYDVIDNAYNQDTDEFVLAKEVKAAIKKKSIKEAKAVAIATIKSLAEFAITGKGPSAKKCRALVGKYAEAAYKHLCAHWEDLNESLVEGRNDDIMPLSYRPRKGHTLEAYGRKGMKNTRWRKFFKSSEELEKWCDDNDATVEGSRDLDETEKVK